jgi:hypothetical protein
MDGTERELFARSLRHATAGHSGGALDRALAEVGWLDALAEDPRTAVSTLFELQGRANAASSALDDVLVHALGAGTGPPTAVVLPPLGQRHAPGDAGDGGLAVRGLGTGALTRRARALVVADGAGGPVAYRVDPAELTARRVSGLDPQLGWSQVDGRPSRATGGGLDPAAWGHAVACGQVAVGHELVGAARAMLALARDHAVDRVQFGRPISGFQAVRHRLAESLVAVEAADAALAAAWDAPSPQAAAVAKAVAGRGARTVARHGQQVLAGVGFTTDHAFHRHLRRVLVLDQLLGSARLLTRELGEELLRTRRLPVLLPL